jgi:choline dehydrogenase-like flavoprotein
VISDLRELPIGQALDADVCVIGSGAAGISLALQFVGSSTRVCVLEGGGEQLEPSSQQLYDIENVGDLRVFGSYSRLRMFGGTTNHWTGRCAPLDAIDFQHRPWVAHSGWPITRKQLDPYYTRAQGVCDLGPFRYDEHALDALRLPDARLDRDKLDPQLWQFSAPTRFARKYGPTLQVAQNIQVWVHANATGIRLNPEGSAVDHVEAMTPEGKRHQVRARTYVLACGGIENPRLLLLSDDVHKTGIANERDLVGRYFMQHLRVDATLAMEGDPYIISRLYGRHDTESTQYVMGLRLSDSYQQAHKLLNGSLYSYRERDVDPESGSGSLLSIAQDFGSGTWPEHLGKELFNVVADFSDVALNVRRRFLTPSAEPYSRVMRSCMMEAEQAPNPDSRIRLAAQTDALGMRRAVADWRATTQDFLSVQQLMMTLASELGRLYKARMGIPYWLSDPQFEWTRHIREVSHHMGTTRMAQSPASGVVDADCRVHGVPNLFIAGSSVFPTGGQANPTLTIVALALRLADHIKEQLK